MLFTECCFHLDYLGAVLVGINHLVFQKELIIEDWLPSNSTTYTTSPSSVWLMLVHFACPMISSVPHYCTAYIFFIAHHNLFKNGMFLLHLSRELHLEIQSRKFFFPLVWNPNIKAINICKLVPMILNAWFGYFEYVSHLLPGIMLIVLN